MADARRGARPDAPSETLSAADLDALPAHVRADFPALHPGAPAPPGGAPLVYLDSAATTQKPECVIEAVARYYREGVGNVHRGAHALGGRASEAHEGARRAVAHLLHAGSPEEIVLVGGCTAAINLVAHAFGDAQVGPGDEVIVTRLEHHSNLLPWQRLCERRGATLRVVPLTERGELDLDQLAAWLSPRTRLVAVAHVSNTVGGILPVREVVELAHAAGARVLVDGAQAVARQPVDVRELGCDFYAFSGHKLYAPAGIGALYARREVLERLPPFMTGGGMVDQVGATSSSYAEAPRRFEAGTPNVEGAVGLARAIEYLEGLDLARVMRHDQALTRYARAALARVPGLRLIGEPARPLGVVTFVLSDIHAHDASSILDEAGVAVRAGHHCASLALEHFGVSATLRASFGVYNTRADVDALVAALARVREVFAR
jgi:cysteine desulfurase / selenocysteine lyase